MSANGVDWVAGVDSCPGAWIAVLLDPSGTEAPCVHVRLTVADIADLPEAPRVIAVDMPIGLPDRVFETHPEVCFLHMNGGAPASLPKKIKSRVNPDGLEERRGLLRKHGFPADFLAAYRKPPRPSAADDFLDACAAAWTASRIRRGEAVCYPDPPPRDAFGLEMAIRA